MRRSAVGTSETSVHPRERSRDDASDVEAGSTSSGVLGDDRAGDHRQASDVGERQAREPAVASGIDAEPRSLVALGGGRAPHRG